jgi:hypothetical protein
VVGVDISKEAVDFAKEHNLQSNLSFLQGSLEEIPIDGVKKFDVVASFETIEHVDAGAQERFLKEVKRLLKDDGVFVVSTPNKLFYSDIPKYKNEFHIREFYEKEFVEFLRKYFKQVSLLGQKVFTGSDMWELGSSKHEGSFVEHQITNDGQRFVTSDQEKEALYLVAVCSDAKIEAAENSFLVDISLSILSERDAQIANLHQTVAERDSELGVIRNELHSIYTSKKWRLVMNIATPVMFIKAGILKVKGWRWLTNPLMQVKRYLRGAAVRAKKAYLLLPLSPQTRVAHMHFLVKYAPWVLRAVKGQPITVSAPAMKALQPLTRDFDSNDIRLKTSSQPVVSVIIPIYGECDYTLRCLASIAANSPSVPFEVIVIDDHSSDNSAEVLKRVEGIRLISNSKNQGFIRSCNIGAKVAAGQYLHFLNNDTIVTPGWLDELVRTFQEFPGTGLVGSKLVYPNGT